jgi:uncharacterized membrane protein
MNANTPIVLAAARYKDRAGAEQDFRVVWDANHEGEFDHMAVAVLTKGPDGKLQVERHDSTAEHLTWLGAALVVVAPPVGVKHLAWLGAPVVVVAPPVGVGVIAGGAGAGAIVGHFWDNIPKKRLDEAASLLRSGESGLIVVAVNRRGEEIAPLLEHADRRVVVNTVAGDLEAEIEKELQQAKAKTSA